MKSAVVVEAGVVEIRDRPNPELKPDEVLVAPLFVGLCGSDVSYFRKGANGTFLIREPLTLGHEIVARIEDVGTEAAGGFIVGDRVIVHPAWPTPLPGEHVVPQSLAAETPHFLGSASTWPHTQGGLVEHLAVRPERLRRVPDELPSTRAALAEPLAVVLHALDRHQARLDGATVIVCGAGPIGLLAAVALKDRGAAFVALTDLHERPLSVGIQIGADAGYRIGDTENAVPIDTFDLAIEATGVASSLDAALAALRVGGTIIQLGMLPKEGVTADLAQVVVKELTLIGTHRFLGEIDAAIDLLARSPRLDAVVTDIQPLDEIADALHKAGDAAGSSKVLVSIGA
jgi:L-idonate 5-dehydrogenase